MTLHPRKPGKQAVGVRELHDHLSRYLRHVDGGGEVVVTSRGRPIARLLPAQDGDPLDGLRKRGIVQDPIRPKRRAGARRRPIPSSPVADLVEEQRR